MREAPNVPDGPSYAWSMDFVQDTLYWVRTFWLILCREDTYAVLVRTLPIIILGLFIKACCTAGGHMVVGAVASELRPWQVRLCIGRHHNVCALLVQGRGHTTHRRVWEKYFAGAARL